MCSANWYEDRLADPYSFVEANGRKHVRDLETTVPALRIPRIDPLETNNGRIVSDYGCSNQMYQTSNNFFHGKKKQLVPEPRPKLIDFNMATTSGETVHSEAIFDKTDFRSNIARHAPSEHTRSLHTTTHSFYGGRDALDEAKRTIPRPADRSQPAGRSDYVSTISHHGKSLNSGATGEQVKTGAGVDPSVDTFVNRSWETNRNLNRNYQKPLFRPQRNIEREALPGLGLTIVSDFDVLQGRNGNYRRNNDALSANTGVWKG